MTITIDFPSEQAARLEDAARQEGVAVAALLQRLTTEYLERKAAFESAADYVLAKNAELYRRLAK